MNVKQRLLKLEQSIKNDAMEIIILKIDGKQPLPESAIIGCCKISYQYAEVDEK
ncbi:MAG: hypothetical protein NTX38_14600 [Methylobacter sp.]|nr:hypothetical protein [Methylobacter sp.]